MEVARCWRDRRHVLVMFLSLHIFLIFEVKAGGLDIALPEY